MGELKDENEEQKKEIEMGELKDENEEHKTTDESAVEKGVTTVEEEVSTKKQASASKSRSRSRPRSISLSSRSRSYSRRNSPQREAQRRRRSYKKTRKKEICRNFSRYGECRFGENCRYSHGPSNSYSRSQSRSGSPFKEGTGVISSLNERGFGFISPGEEDENSEIYFHCTALGRSYPFDDLREGDEVEYEYVMDHKKNKPRAKSVKPKEKFVRSGGRKRRGRSRSASRSYERGRGGGRSSGGRDRRGGGYRGGRDRSRDR